MCPSYGTKAAADAAAGQMLMIFPAATGALLGAAWGVADIGSIVIASVAPSCNSGRCDAGNAISAVPARPDLPERHRIAASRDNP